MLSVWTNVSLPPDKFMSAVKETAVSVRSHVSCLIKWKNTMALLRIDSNPNKDRIDTHFVLPNPTEPVVHVDIWYRALDDALERKAGFQFIVLDNIFENFGIPEDRKARFRWFEEFTLGCRCKLFYIIKMSPFNKIDNIYCCYYCSSSSSSSSYYYYYYYYYYY